MREVINTWREILLFEIKENLNTSFYPEILTVFVGSTWQSLIDFLIIEKTFNTKGLPVKMLL